MRLTMLALGHGRTRLFRNNVGVAVYPNGERVAYGLHPGSSDLVGYHTVEITADMIGRRVAVFTAMEVKTDDGRLSGKQKNFIRAVRDAGGIAGVVRTAEDGR